jgi:flagellar biosynthesis/type III secretory pathway protein FliH
VAEQVAQMRARVEADAFASGRAAGIQEAGESAREQLMRVLQALTEATASVQAHEQRWLGNVEENLAAAAVTVARHLIHRELTAEPSVITDLVKRSLQQFPLERNITVRLHPDDLTIVQQALLDDPDGATAQRDVRWHADPHIVRGGCLVDGRERVLDGRIDTALERAYRALGQVQA